MHPGALPGSGDREHGLPEPLKALRGLRAWVVAATHVEDTYAELAVGGSLFQRDYILRLVQQVAQGIARAMGLIKERKLEDADAELASGYSTLGLDRGLVGVLDAAGLARLLGDEDRIAAAVRLIAYDARLWLAQGDQRRGARLLRSARGLMQQLTEPAPAIEQELDDAEAELQAMEHRT